MAEAALIEPDVIRAMFARALSGMYQAEVPLYGKLLRLVSKVNEQILADDPGLRAKLEQNGELPNLNSERHGAIRLGSGEELSAIRRVFAVMGMFPVGYYDLSPAGLPVHSTAFRPIGCAAMRRSPFRVFTSLLRLELIEDEDLRRDVCGILAKRIIISPNAYALLDIYEGEGGLSAEQAETFVSEVVETFRWHQEARVTVSTYDRLNKAGRLIADVVSFKGPHLNHLTPRALDIDKVQAAMLDHGMAPKEAIEGPPRRKCPILLRQTSFKAQEEPAAFAAPSGAMELRRHTARFGEVEQRGAALKPKGRQLYDEALNSARRDAAGERAEHSPSGYMTEFEQRLSSLPDDWSLLRADGLAYFRYEATVEGMAAAKTQRLPHSIETLIERGFVDYEPIVYEDFLPVSAAGIFQSNLDASACCGIAESSRRAALEEALGGPILDESKIYAHAEMSSLDKALADLGLSKAGQSSSGPML